MTRWIAPAAGTVAALAAGTGFYLRYRRKCHRFPISVRAAIIEDVESDRWGTTLWVRFREAPFDAERLSLIFIPKGVRAKNKCVNIALHWHGHNAFVPTKVVQHDLRRQVAESGRNVVLVMPQTAIMVRDSSAGRFEEEGQFDRFVAEVLATLHEEAPMRFGRHCGLGHLMVSTHSGGYRVTAKILEQRGDAVSEVILYDSLYANVDEYVEWVQREAASRPIRLINLHLGGSVEERTEDLHQGFERGGLAVDWVAARPESTSIPEWIQATHELGYQDVEDVTIAAPSAFVGLPVRFPAVASVDMRPTDQRHTWLPLGNFRTMLQTSGFPRA